MKGLNPFAALVALIFAISAAFAPVVQADAVQDPAGEAAQVQFEEGGDWDDDWEDDDEDDEWDDDEWEGDW